MLLKANSGNCRHSAVLVFPGERRSKLAINLMSQLDNLLLARLRLSTRFTKPLLVIIVAWARRTFVEGDNRSTLGTEMRMHIVSFLSTAPTTYDRSSCPCAVQLPGIAAQHFRTDRCGIRNFVLMAESGSLKAKSVPQGGQLKYLEAELLLPKVFEN